MNTMYYDFAMGIKSKLCEDVNGKITFEAYPPIDTVIFKVNFKNFEYAHAVNNVQDRIYSGTVDDITEEFKKEYMTSIRKAFFKTDNHKRRDEMSRMGIVTE